MSDLKIDENDWQIVAERLLAWFDATPRSLPWREQPTPYRVWVSEIMLQQTRVGAVIPYFERFLRELPDVAALANVDEDRLMKLWEGLGYYSRARNLQKAARQMVERHGGELPDDYEALLALPGVGEYTAGAVASIAFGIPVPAVDGNVLRVMARLLCYHGDVLQPTAKAALRDAVVGVLPHDRPGDFNEAVMDLGETVCLPGESPRCELCPLNDLCEGNLRGEAGRLPVRTPKKPRTIERKTVLVVVCGGRVLLRRRPPKGLLAGLWEFPNLVGWLDEEAAQSALAGLGVAPVGVTALANARHIFTHREWEMHGWLIEAATQAPVEGCEWVSGDELAGGYALPGAFSAYAAALNGRL